MEQRAQVGAPRPHPVPISLSDMDRGSSLPSPLSVSSSSVCAVLALLPSSIVSFCGQDPRQVYSYVSIPALSQTSARERDLLRPSFPSSSLSILSSASLPRELDWPFAPLLHRSISFNPPPPRFLASLLSPSGQAVPLAPNYEAPRYSAVVNAARGSQVEAAGQLRWWGHAYAGLLRRGKVRAPPAGQAPRQPAACLTCACLYGSVEPVNARQPRPLCHGSLNIFNRMSIAF